MEAKLKHIPNTITIARIIMSFGFVYFAIKQFVYGQCVIVNLILLFSAICFSDLIDGRIARRFGYTSIVGAKLDVSADLIYILLSYTTMIAVNILPIWFLVFVCFKFIEFILTSNYINSRSRFSNKPFVFDKIGRIVSACFFLVPGIACIIKCLMPMELSYLINIILYTLFFAGMCSSYLRIKNCFNILRSEII